jgi:hypothetical protein
MNTKYVIEDATLNDIADAIRGKTNETETIKTLDFASKIANIDLSTEEYMAIVDMGLTFAIDGILPTYSEYEINKVDNYIKYYGGELNG